MTIKYTPRKLGDNVNVTPTHPVKEFLILAGGLLGIVIGIYVLMGFAVDLVAPRVSPAVEQRIADLIFQHQQWEKGQGEKETIVQTMVDDMQQACARLPYVFQIHVQESPMINALALPGGHIIVFTGLLEKVTTENELAFILAHEMGHYAHRDHLRGLGRALVLTAISTALFGADSSLSNLLGQSLNITEMSFSRTQETRADEFALRTLACHYGHVGASTDFFGKIPKEMDPGKFGHYFSSHPENRRRIAHLKDYAQQNGFSAGDLKALPAGLLSEETP
jgi:Zn-dependent protease with chaperone function